MLNGKDLIPQDANGMHIITLCMYVCTHVAIQNIYCCMFIILSSCLLIRDFLHMPDHQYSYAPLRTIQYFVLKRTLNVS